MVLTAPLMLMFPDSMKAVLRHTLPLLPHRHRLCAALRLAQTAPVASLVWSDIPSVSLFPNTFMTAAPMAVAERDLPLVLQVPVPSASALLIPSLPVPVRLLRTTDAHPLEVPRRCFLVTLSACDANMPSPDELPAFTMPVVPLNRRLPAVLQLLLLGIPVIPVFMRLVAVPRWITHELILGSRVTSCMLVGCITLFL